VDWEKIGLKFEIGFAQPTTALTDTGYSGTAAIDQVIPLNYTTGGISGLTYDTKGELYDSSGNENTTYTNAGNDATWLDIDFVMDYANSEYDVYVNGVLVKNNGNMTGTPVAANLYGFQITPISGHPTNEEGYVSYVMIDRMGLVRCLTDNVVGDTDEAPITQLNMRRGVNGISSCDIKVSDIPDLHSDNIRGSNASNYTHNLKDLFVATAALDWQLLIFGDANGRIDRPIWRGIIENFNIKQQRRDRIIEFQAKDALSVMDRTVPLWEVGQESLDDSETETPYWLYEAQGFKDTMNMGARKLKLLGADIGFDVDSGHIETSTQRTQLGSGHPIQMYNNENAGFGPDNVEDYHEGLGIIGFSEDTSGNTQIHLSRSNHGLSGTPSITITNSTNHNGTYTASSVSGDIITVAGGTLAVTGETAKIVYMGKAWGPFFDPTQYSNRNAAEWQYSINPNNPHPNDYPDADDQPHDLNIIFDADPGLNINDEFYVNGRDIGNSPVINSVYRGRHRVKQIKTTRSYFDNSNVFDILYWVKTYTVDDASSDFGSFTNGSVVNTDALKTGNDRVEWSKDTGTITTVTEFPERVLHARWMRDLPQSLWFQYHFGKIKFDPANVNGSGVVIGTPFSGVSYTSASTTFRVPVSTYDVMPQYGVAEIYRRNAGENETYIGKFIYQGKVAVGSDRYLIGCKYMPTFTTDANKDKIRVQDFDNDYKHIWLLWSDMRNNGKADADGADRKSDFGLQYPINDNYNFDLFYVDQKDSTGKIDKFASLKAGEDLSVWTVDATSDPITGGAFSKPADYANPVSATLSDASGKLKITISSDDMTNKFPSGVDYVHLVGSTAHDGIHTITAKNSTELTTATTYSASTYAIGSASVVYASTGSDVDSSEYQDWEDKAGAFVVIDSAPFFNLNTHINNGKTQQVGGGRTDLTDYVATDEGFPTLIDNYWREATPSYLTTGSRALEHPSAKYLISDATFVTDIDDDGVLLETTYKGLPVDDASIFPDEGYGLIRAITSTNNNEVVSENFYFSHDSKLETELGAFTVASVSTNSSAYGGFAANTTQIITVSGATFAASGVKEGMILIRTDAGDSSTERHNILNVGEVDETNTATKLVVSGTNFAATDTFVIPVQLGKVFMTQLTKDEINLGIADHSSFDVAIQEKFNVQRGPQANWDVYGLKSPSEEPKSVEVHPTYGSAFMLRLLMHMDGFVKSRNSGTFFESDKIRALWNAAITKTWMPPTRLTAMYDINNVPITSIMTTYNDTSSNDSYGSILQTSGKTLASILNAMRQKSGFGDTNSLKTTFSYLIGRDGRLEFRPKFNSHLAFTRENMKTTNFNTQLTSQITNVRVYYNKGASFIDFPKPGLTDTTRWKILQYPSIIRSDEAEMLAKQEYNKSQNTPMELVIEPILLSDVNNKMIDGGRYGYIADPYIALKGINADVAAEYKYVTNWTRLGSGGVLFPGMVSALDGNQATTTDIYARYGNSSIDTSSSTITYDNNYTWYGANSISYAVQIVHATRNLPLTNAAGHSMRIWVDLANQTGTSIDEAQFVINLANYNFGADRDRNDSIQGSISTITVKHSGFYEISVPTTYDSSAGGKIVVSFNAEYCRALLRHRCGDPSKTDHSVGNSTHSVDANYYILDSSVDNGSGSINKYSIFPLGLRKHSFPGGTMTQREYWYAPRVHICNDMAYHPATIVSVTDPGVGLNTATDMVIKKLSWSVQAGKTDSVRLALERDESIRRGGLMTQLYDPNNQGVGMGQGQSTSESLGPPPVNGLPPPSNTPSTDVTPDLVNGGGTIDFNQSGYGDNNSVGIGNLDSGIYGRTVGGRMDMRDLGNSRLAILGSKKTGVMQTAMRGIEGSDVSITATGGSAFLSAEGYVFGAKGRAGDGEGNMTSQIVSLETQFTTPEDVVNDKLNITAKVTCGGSGTGGNAVLEVTATIPNTGTTVTNTVNIPTNTENKIIDLIPITKLTGLKTSKERVEVKIVRKPGTGNDNANNTSVILHNLDVRMERASVPGKATSAQFSTFS